MKHLINRENIFAIITLSALLFLANSSALAQQYSAWSAPENLGSTINTVALEGCPFIAKYNLTLFFASNRAGGSGLTNIYASRCESEDAYWGTPFNLGAKINRSGAEVCPTLSTDGHYLSLSAIVRTVSAILTFM